LYVVPFLPSLQAECPDIPSFYFQPRPCPVLNKQLAEIVGRDQTVLLADFRDAKLEELIRLLGGLPVFAYSDRVSFVIADYDECRMPLSVNRMKPQLRAASLARNGYVPRISAKWFKIRSVFLLVLMDLVMY
jgi:hypothetical protein